MTLKNVEPENEKIYFNLGMLSMDDKKFEEAKAWFDKAIEVLTYWVFSLLHWNSLCTCLLCTKCKQFVPVDADNVAGSYLHVLCNNFYITFFLSTSEALRPVIGWQSVTFLSMQFLWIYKRHEFRTLCANSMWWEVVALLVFLYFLYFQKNTQKFCIDRNRIHKGYQAAVLTTPVMSSYLPCINFAGEKNRNWRSFGDFELDALSICTVRVHLVYVTTAPSGCRPSGRANQVGLWVRL